MVEREYVDKLRLKKDDLVDVEFQASLGMNRVLRGRLGYFSSSDGTSITIEYRDKSGQISDIISCQYIMIKEIKNIGKIM